jgi:hypothetical protein
MRIRRPLFVFFLVLFIVILPFLLTYALGYDLVAIAKGRLVRTGGVFVASTPPSARLTIDGKEQSRRTPVSVISLPVGVHAATLQLAGFRPWVRPVRVKPGEVTVVEDALLIPQKWQQKLIASSAFSDLYPQPIGPYLLFRRSQRLRDLWLYDTRADQIVQPALSGPVPGTAIVRSLHTEPSSTSLLLEVTVGTTRKVLRGKILWPSLLLQDVTRLFPGPLDSVQWSPQDADTIFVTRGDRLYRVQVRAGTSRAYAGRSVAGFTLEGRTIYAVDQRMGLWKLDAGNGEWQALHAFDAQLAGLPDRSEVSLSVPTPDFIVVQGAGGQLFAGWPTVPFSVSGVRGFQAAPSQGRLLAWQKSWMAVASLVPPADTAHPLPAVSTEWIPSRGGSITQAWFVYGVTHVLYHGGDQVTLHAPSHDGKDFSYWVATVQDGTSAWFSDETGRVYYIDGATGKPAWTQVVAQPQPLANLLQEIRDLTGGGTGGS